MILLPRFFCSKIKVSLAHLLTHAHNNICSSASYMQLIFKFGFKYKALILLCIQLF